MFHISARPPLAAVVATVALLACDASVASADPPNNYGCGQRAYNPTLTAGTPKYVVAKAYFPVYCQGLGNLMVVEVQRWTGAAWVTLQMVHQDWLRGNHNGTALAYARCWDTSNYRWYRTVAWDRIDADWVPVYGYATALAC
jgi:hypothetical protein